MSKTIEQYFVDWENSAFGYGYGTGEPHTLAALKGFFDALGRPDNPNAYDYRILEQKLTPTVAWLMINILCREDVIEYGTSPRGGWLTQAGEALRAFVDAHSVEELDALTERRGGYASCCRDVCNCGDNSVLGPACPNPFWDRS
ncbi:hypothetical protein [Bradyrhizobium sp. SZCCHNR2032]|uniref:hypothetical protein n=1 Tax=Bradyrhizobium sp. SZCCHNR2032 TaxID=3057384 RepID=UPI002916CB81|nr:hypothetical protein [Bradyrhizobium sp. SZCCHNR2032]